MTLVDGVADDVTRSLASVYAAEWSADVRELLFAPEGRGTAFSLDDGFDLMDEVVQDEELQTALVPLCLVDERSIACVVMEDGVLDYPAGVVVRLFLKRVPDHHQLAILDVDPLAYVHSLQIELGARAAGLALVLDEVGPAYEETYLANEKRPRDFVVRPVRVACQNVIVGLAAIAQDSAFDGLSVVAWQTCEVPHVATHEANRALAALMLADAFQNGGTMEIRFDRPARLAIGEELRDIGPHPEGGVPASLKRFGRSVGVDLGSSDDASISPAEARDLFLAVTPMPPGLRSRIAGAVERRGITPERLCFTLLSQTWREIELDFLLGCSDRAGSILEGGASWENRSARQAEMEISRCAVTIGMLYRRLNGRDAAGAEGTRVVEDVSLGVDWVVDEDLGAVTFHGLEPGSPIPWGRGERLGDETHLTAFPRSQVSDETRALIADRAERGPVALVVPLDARISDVADVRLLRCPDRTADLDKTVEARLLTSRIARG